jgi:para-nitrobenzyl esterase
VEDGLTVYCGIPFAAPPIGDLRWRAPLPPAKWTGVRQADKYAPYCMQGKGHPRSARDLARDTASGWQTWTRARKQSSLGKGKAYLYYFDQHPDYPVGSPEEGHGAPHGRDLPYVFGHLNALSGGEKATDAGRHVSDIMSTCWTNFTKYGNPNGAGVLHWPAFTEENELTMDPTATPHPETVPNLEGLKVLDAYIAWRRSPEGFGPRRCQTVGKKCHGHQIAK